MKEVGIIRRAGAASLSWPTRSLRPCEKNSYQKRRDNMKSIVLAALVLVVILGTASYGVAAMVGRLTILVL